MTYFKPSNFFFSIKCVIAFSAILFLHGCTTTSKSKIPMLTEEQFNLKSICQKNNINCQWDSASQIITMKVLEADIRAMIGSALVLVGDKKVFLSTPFRISKSMIIAPPDFVSRIIVPLKEKPIVKEKIVVKEDFRVVVDAGHGGKDPGALGKNGVKEKDVVLDISKRVARNLTANGVKIKMTRSRDEFITLNRRTEIASEFNADLFVSIHANSSPVKTVHGVEVYSSEDLGFNDKNEVQRITNQKILYSHLAMKRSHFLDKIVEDLQYVDKQRKSAVFAEKVARRLSANVKTKDLGGKEARFFVLRNTLVPAILIETGFLTNPKEERMLKSILYRQKLADAIADAILEYISHE